MNKNDTTNSNSTNAAPINVHDNEQLEYKLQFLKLKRIIELNNRLKQQLVKERITSSNACLSLIDYTTTTIDYMLPTLWGYPKVNSNPLNNRPLNEYSNHKRFNKKEHGSVQGGCCEIM
ncbi:Ste18p SCDLUD_000110 [Saccharomycodes ludwigii]|uniref:Ste18p n=1 Tax=Saccharomycodes ludwigii TaxID=36035 RepID=UPI001E8C22F1|nr:hypothetical protein SCDLUD_000110 [Saccharomycodes ludwigii]KAH3902531.1 hypothetical protein SCDLUD_000110 [Saccharomycodes ludwigii]